MRRTASAARQPRRTRYGLAVRSALRYGVAVAAATLLLGGACSGDGSGPTTTEAGVSSTAPAPTTTVAASVTTSLASTVPVGPAVAEAGGWRLVITAPTLGATIGPSFNLCYEVTGPAQADVAFDVDLTSAVTGTPATSDHVNAALGRGSALVDVGQADPRAYNLTVQALVNGQAVDGLAVRIAVLFGSAEPAGCP